MCPFEPIVSREQAHEFMRESLKNLDDKEEKIKKILQSDLPHSLNFIVNYINSVGVSTAAG